MKRFSLLFFVIILAVFSACKKLDIIGPTVNDGHKIAIVYKGHGNVKIQYYDKSNNLATVIKSGDFEWRYIKDVEIGDTVTYYITELNNEYIGSREFSQDGVKFKLYNIHLYQSQTLVTEHIVKELPN